MDTTDDDTPYCRLYIDTRESREAVQALLDTLASAKFERLEVDAKVFKNHGWFPARSSSQPYDPIEASPWTAEMDAEDSSPRAFETFQAGTSAVIRELREAGFIVTASCDFEDRIAAETGWNWTAASPEPPVKVR
jgi:hypothetical protein